MTSGAALQAIEQAVSPAALFGAAKNPAGRYRELLFLVHPDRFTDATERVRAAAAAGKLAKLYNDASGKTARSPAVLGKWIVEGPLAKGDVADLYSVVREDGTEGVLKIARSAANNDLMDAESGALKILSKAEPEHYRTYIPQLLEFFQASGRRANVMARHSGGYISLARIRDLLPGGVPFRHIVWMMNRLLSVIGFSEHAGLVHGGITPDHLLYHPETHHLVLVGWCSAASIAKGESIRIVANGWPDLYPGEISRKWKCGAGTNVFMAAKSMLYAADRIPPKFQGLIDWCLAQSPSARPEAWELQDLWKRQAEEEFGTPKYVKLELPVH